MLFIMSGSLSRASISLGIYNVWEGLCVLGLVSSVSVGAGGLRGFLTFGAPGASFGVFVLAIFGS